MNLSENHYRVLGALRSATVLKREPRVLTPEGYQRWWSLTELANQGRLPHEMLAELSSAARGLYKNRLVQMRTTLTVTRYAVTPEGLLALAAHEAETGNAGVIAAAMDLDQAEEDERQAERALAAAVARAAEARQAFSRAVERQADDLTAGKRGEGDA
jgi:hypothetical protein